jgi:hypothetical protein
MLNPSRTPTLRQLQTQPIDITDLFAPLRATDLNSKRNFRPWQCGTTRHQTHDVGNATLHHHNFRSKPLFFRKKAKEIRSLPCEGVAGSKRTATRGPADGSLASVLFTPGRAYAAIVVAAASSDQSINGAIWMHFSCMNYTHNDSIANHDETVDSGEETRPLHHHPESYVPHEKITTCLRCSWNTLALLCSPDPSQKGSVGP